MRILRIAFVLFIVLKSQAQSNRSEISRDGLIVLNLPFVPLSSRDRELVSGDFRFCSEGTMGMLLPSGWSLPLFESSAVQTSENSVMIALPCGGKRAFDFPKFPREVYKDPAGWSISRDGNSVTVKSEDGATYKFRDGRLRELTSVDGRVQRWSYEENRYIFENGSDSQRATLVMSKLGVDNILKLVCGGGTSELHFANPPIDVGRPDFDALSGMEKIYFNGNSISFANIPIADGVEGLDIEFPFGVRAYRWNSISREVSRIDKTEYSVLRPGSDMIEPLIVYSDEVNKSATLQSGVSHPSAGVTETIEADGSRIREYRIASGKIRKIERISPVGDVSEVFRASYDENLLPIRESRGEFTRVLIDGVYKVFRDGKLVRQYKR